MATVYRHQSIVKVVLDRTVRRLHAGAETHIDLSLIRNFIFFRNQSMKQLIKLIIIHYKL